MIEARLRIAGTGTAPAPAVEEDVAFGVRLVLQLNGKVVETRFLIVTRNIRIPIEFT